MENTEKEENKQQEIKWSDLPWGARWLAFVNDVSIVGLKYAVAPTATQLRRLVWALFVAAGVGFMMYQIFERYCTHDTCKIH